MSRFVVSILVYFSLLWRNGDAFNPTNVLALGSNRRDDSQSNHHDQSNWAGSNQNGANSYQSNPHRYYPEDADSEVMEKAHIKHGIEPYLLIMHPNPNVTQFPTKVPVYKWTFTAAEDCKPQITCPQFNIAPRSEDNKCLDQYLEVTDGILGSQRFCGNVGPVQTVSTYGLRDLYVTFKNFRPPYPAELECFITCGQKEIATDLIKNLEPRVNHKCTCGQKPNRNRIIGGRDINAGEFPWIAAMVVKNTRQPYCIGSVINDRMILTAGHCFKGRFRKPNSTQIILNGYILDPMPNINVIKGPASYKVYDLQTLDRLDRENKTFRFDVDHIYIHPLYNAVTSDFDTAVMILSKPIDPSMFREYSPICLPELKYDVDTYSGWTASISGWGLPAVDAPGTATVMKQITVDIFKSKECERYFGPRFVSPHRIMCAAYPDSTQDSCAGDSGGPLILQYKPQAWYQIGIISWGDGCAVEGNPGIYYRTTSTNQWIRHMSNAKEAIWCKDP